MPGGVHESPSASRPMPSVVSVGKMSRYQRRRLRKLLTEKYHARNVLVMTAGFAARRTNIFAEGVTSSDVFEAFNRVMGYRP